MPRGSQSLRQFRHIQRHWSLSSSAQDLNRAFPLVKNAQRPDRLPLRVLAGGLRLEATMPGKLHAWARLIDG